MFLSSRKRKTVLTHESTKKNWNNTRHGLVVMNAKKNLKLSKLEYGYWNVFILCKLKIVINISENAKIASSHGLWEETAKKTATSIITNAWQ